MWVWPPGVSRCIGISFSSRAAVRNSASLSSAPVQTSTVGCGAGGIGQRQFLLVLKGLLGNLYVFGLLGQELFEDLLGRGEIVGRHGNLEAETGLPIDGEGVGVRLDLIAADRHVFAGYTGRV